MLEQGLAKQSKISAWYFFRWTEDLIAGVGCQGTTLVVPQNTQKRLRALAPAGRSLWF
jgi:hypothetical protein